jgi:hypothetical protein
MILALNQPYWFPYLGYFQLIHAADRFVVYDDVTYIKGGWINRNRILVGGEPHYFTVPTQDASSFKPIRDVAVGEQREWRKKMLRTIEQAYSKAPEFAAVFPLVEAVVRSPEPHVAGLAVASLRAVMGYLGITTELVASSSGYGNADLHGEARVLDICHREGAHVYVNASGGMALYDKAHFAARGVELRFLKPLLTPYRQFGAAFVPGLSIVDVLMFNPRERVQAMLEERIFV